MIYPITNINLSNYQSYLIFLKLLKALFSDEFFAKIKNKIFKQYFKSDALY